MIVLRTNKHLLCNKSTKNVRLSARNGKRESRVENQEPQATLCVRVRTRVIALIHSSSTLIGMCIVCIQNKRTHFKHCKHCMHINGRTTSISQSVGCLCCLIKTNGLIKKNMVGFILLAAQTNKSMKMHAHDPFHYFLFASIARMQYQRMCVCVCTFLHSQNSSELDSRRRTNNNKYSVTALFNTCSNFQTVNAVLLSDALISFQFI